MVERVDADRAVRARAELLRTYVRSLRGGSQATALETVERVIRLLEERGDERRLAEAYNLLGLFRTWHGSMQAGHEAYERAAELAKRFGNARVLAQSSWWRAVNALWGPTTVEDALDLCRRIRNETQSPLTMRQSRTSRVPSSSCATAVPTRSSSKWQKPLRLSRSSASSSPASPHAWRSRLHTCSRVRSAVPKRSFGRRARV